MVLFGIVSLQGSALCVVSMCTDFPGCGSAYQPHCITRALVLSPRRMMELLSYIGIPCEKRLY